MFVTERRFILKTCGTTTLLLAVQPLLQLVKEECGFDTVSVSNTVNFSDNQMFALITPMILIERKLCTKCRWNARQFRL